MIDRRKGQWFKIKPGKRFGKLVVISSTDQKIISKNGLEIAGRLAIFRCDCGKEVIKPYRDAENGRILSCGCYRNQNLIKNKSPNWRGYEEMSGEFWGAIKSSARIRKIQLKISKKYAWEKYIEQDRKCVLSGEPLFFAKTNKYVRAANISLDRIDSSKGYVEGNVQWVTKKVNRMKMDLDEQAFLDLCEKITLYSKSKT